MGSFPNNIEQTRTELLSTLTIREDYSIEILDESTGRSVFLLSFVFLLFRINSFIIDTINLPYRIKLILPQESSKYSFTLR